MKRRLAILTIALCPGILWCTCPLDPSSTALIAARSSADRSRDSDRDPYYPMLMDIDGEETIGRLEALGTIILGRRDNIILACIPTDNLDKIMDMPGINYASLSRSHSPSLDIARPYCNVDLAQSGTELPHGFDGTGVIAGFSDIGFDPHHLAFSGRVSQTHHYNAAQGEFRHATSETEITHWTTDTPSETHATHVANIFTGAYSGNGLTGVAPGCEIIATTSRLTDVGILAGVEDIIQYAHDKDQPAVINLSLSSYTGPHDGTSLICQYLAHCASDAVICVAAGNSGDKTISAHHTFASGDQAVRVAISDRVTYNVGTTSGLTEIWSDDATPVEIRIDVYDWDTKSAIYSTPWLDYSGGTALLSPDSDAGWGKYFTGRIAISGDVYPYNGRHCVSVAYDTYSTERASGKAWSKYFNCIAMRAKAGTSIHVYSDFATSNICNFGLTGEIKVGSLMSISDMATAPGVIAVGSVSTRNSAPKLDSSEPLTWQHPTDEVSPFNGYGTLPDGTVLPHICAPGHYVISAASSPFVASGGAWNLSSVTTSGDSNYYWYADCGTSMASPYMAGVAALWLQADPSLSASDIIRIAQSTARTGYPTFGSNPRWGAGVIDAHAGLKYILDDTHVPDIPSVTDPAELYDLTGRKVTSPSPPPGIYIRRQGHKCEKTYIRAQ